MKFYSCEIEGDAGVELTQAAYDALEAAGKIEPDTNYYIKDGKGVEPGIAEDIEYIRDTLDATFALISEGGASIGGGSVEYLAEEYNPDHTYMTEENCYCMHDGELFKCLEDDTTGTWDSSKWERIYLSEISNTNSNSGELKTLWENPNVNDNFLGQTIPLNLKNIKVIIVTYNKLPNQDGSIDKAYIKNREDSSPVQFTSTTSYGTTQVMKRTAIFNDSGITFSDCDAKDGSTSFSGNNRLVPIKIEG